MLPLAAVACLALTAGTVLGFGPVSPGDDMWITPEGATWDAHPIPAGFFSSAASGEPSNAHTTAIPLRGVPLDPFNLLRTDTIVRRIRQAPVSCGTSATIDIQIVALQLESVQPITVTYPTDPAELWDVDVCLAPAPQPLGSMTINHECEQGGTYDALVRVRPQFTFTRVQPNDGTVQTFVPPGPVNLMGGGWWSHTDLGGQLAQIPFGSTVDTDCDGVNDTPIASSFDFWPGLFSPDCTTVGCGASANFRKVLTLEQELLAQHGVFVANDDKPTEVGACCDTGGQCRMEDPIACIAPESYLGTGVQCQPNPCLTGTPCGDGTCDPSERQCATYCSADCGAPPPEDCSDGLDNDCDGAVDSADTDCQEAPNCMDGVDNDGDGCIDDADSDCDGTETSCTNGLDDDCDGATDCADSDCTADPACSCPNGTCETTLGEDPCNCPDDCGPFQSQENAAGGGCSDGVDNDCDGLVDCDDPSLCFINNDGDPVPGPPCGNDCDDGDPNNYPGNTEDCVDGQDNDCDGQADCLDADCASDPACAGAYENWVIADDFCLECQCECDINKDGNCDTLDIARVVSCYQTPTQPGCSNADMDCDDDVDFDDIKIIVCLFQNPTNPGACCPNNARGVDRVRWWGSYFDPVVCKGSCECDVNGDTLCDAADGSIIIDCIGDPTSHSECSQADLNCDGTVSAGDESVWQCLFQGNLPSVCCANNGSACCSKPNVDSWLVGLHRDIPPIPCPPVPTGTVPIDLCGVAQVCPTDATRLIFQPNGSAFDYELVGALPPVNTEQRICGYIVPNVKRTCPATLDVIRVLEVRPCETKHSRPSKLVGQWVFPHEVVRQRPTGKVGWDGHQIFEYTVDLPDGCLEHDFFRPEEYDPATGAFFPFRNRTYWLSVQAARGHTVDAACNEVATGKTADQDFWGWHTTPPGYQRKDDAYMGQLAMSCTDPMRWEYHWMSPLHCSDPRYRDCCDDPTKSIDMAFYLIRTRKVCVGGGLAGLPCDTDADCAVAGATSGWCVRREKIEWCQPVNPIRPGATPLPGGGIDEFGETVADVVINLPGLSAADLRLTGPTVVTRTNPGIEHEDIGARAIVETEIVAMDLRGSHPDLGDVILRVSNIGSSGQDGIRRQSTGQIDSFFDIAYDIGARAATVDSFFDVWTEVSLEQQGILALSEGPVRVEAQLHEVPPTDVQYQSTPAAVNLVDASTGAVIGSIKSVTHTVPYKGGINIHSDVDWTSSPIDDCCEPNATGTGCSNPVCPNAPDDECIPTEFHVDPDTGITTVTDCDCVKVSPPAECHLVAVPGADPVCEGACPNGLVCDPVPVAETQADGTIKYHCPCEPVAKEACCLFDGTCVEVTDPADCCAQGGIPQGAGTDCTTAVCPLPAPLDVGMNIDVHMDIPGEVANDFHIEGIVKSTCAPKLKEHIDDLFPNFTYTFTPLGGDMYEFKADWSLPPLVPPIQYCQVLHLGLLFEVCCRNVMIDLVGWWTFDGNRIGGGAVAGFTAANDGYWPVIGFDVQDNLALPITTTQPQTVRLRNDSGLGTPIPIELVQLELVGLPAPIPFDQLRVGGAQESLPWVPLLLGGKPVDLSATPLQLLPGDEIVVILRPPGNTAGGGYSADAPLGPGDYLYVRGLMQFTGNDGGGAVAGGQELRWFFDAHEAHNLPEPEACCFEDGTCIEVIPQQCICDGGRPLGPGTLCDTDGDGVDDACDPTCEPNADETACERVACPDDPNGLPQECTQKCMTIDPVTGVVKVTVCDCQSPDDCHAEVASTSGGGGNVAGTGTGPCVVPDDGSGTVQLPPDGCAYLSPDEVHEIIDGLPAGTTIELGAIHKDFICSERTQDICSFPIIPSVDCDDVGGSLGGEQECSSSTLELAMNGNCPGDLCGFSRSIALPVAFETHIGPRLPGDPVQDFDTDMFRLQGELPPGDPDFDLLRIRAGTDFGLPSPGHTTLTRLPSGDFQVDSFFDVEYQIEFQGAPGSVLEGMSGSTTGTIRMSTPGSPVCKGDCAPGEICVERKTVLADGTIEVCCDCQTQPADCQPTADAQGCEPTVCPNANEECVPQGAQCANGRQDCDVTGCDCQDANACHLELVDIDGTSVARCTGGCPSAGYCALTTNATTGAFECRCRTKPSKPVLVPGIANGNRTIGVGFSDAGAVAGGGSNLAVRVTMNTLYNTDPSHPTLPACPPRTTEPDLSVYEGEWRWFGPPAEYSEDTLPAMLNLLGSELVCCPHARDWSPAALSAEFDGAGGIPGDVNENVVFGFGEEAIPCSRYSVQTVEPAFCSDLTDESCYSAPVVVQTGLWGNLFAPHDLINFVDINAEVQKFKGIPYAPGPPEAGGPPKARAALRGNQVDLTEKINFIDIGLVVEAFKLIQYRFDGPIVHCNPPAPTCP